MKRNPFKMQLSALTIRAYWDWANWFFSIRVGYNFEFEYFEAATELGPLEVILSWN